MVKVNRDNEVEAAVMEVYEADPDNYLRLQGLADCSILEDGQNPFDLVEPLLSAGVRIAARADEIFAAFDGSSTYYFVGRKGEVIRSIKSLLA